MTEANGVVDEGFLQRYRQLLDAEDTAFDELEHAYEDGDRATTTTSSPNGRRSSSAGRHSSSVTASPRCRPGYGRRPNRSPRPSGSTSRLPTDAFVVASAGVAASIPRAGRRRHHLRHERRATQPAVSGSKWFPSRGRGRTPDTSSGTAGCRSGTASERDRQRMSGPACERVLAQETVHVLELDLRRVGIPLAGRRRRHRHHHEPRTGRGEAGGGLVDQPCEHEASGHGGRAHALTADESVVAVPTAQPDHNVGTDLRQPGGLVLRYLSLARGRPLERGAGEVDRLPAEDAAAGHRRRVQIHALFGGSVLGARRAGSRH